MATKTTVVHLDDDNNSLSDTSLESETICVTPESDKTDDDSPRKHKLIDISRQFEHDLKYNKAEEEALERAGKDCIKQPCVHFDTKVLVVEITSHRDYTKSSRQRMWNSFQEIQENAERNILEFRADNWEWRNATEESEMFMESVGELVHPASYKQFRPGQKRKLGKKQTRLRRRKARQYAR